MARSAPEDAPVPLDDERERTVARLGEHFAHDSLTLEELERRIELAYRARDLATLRELTLDLPSAPEQNVVAPAAPTPVPELFVSEEGRVVAIMSQRRCGGIWQLPRCLKVWSVMSETTIDVTQAILPAGVTELDLRGIMTSLKIIVPPEVRVVMQAGSFMSEVADHTSDPPPLGSGAPVIRVTGFVVMGELKVLVRRRESLTETSDVP